jgi:hypothetical protein
MSVCATPTAWLVLERDSMKDRNAILMHEPLLARMRSHQGPEMP